MLDRASSTVCNPVEPLATIHDLLRISPDDGNFVDCGVTCGLSVSRKAPASFILDASIAAASRMDAGPERGRRG